MANNIGTFTGLQPNAAPMFNNFGFGNAFDNTRVPAFGNQWTNQNTGFQSRGIGRNNGFARNTQSRNNGFARNTQGQRNNGGNGGERSPEERLTEMREEEERRREEERQQQEEEERRQEEEEEFDEYNEEMETRRKARILGGRESTSTEKIGAAALVAAGWGVLPVDEAEIYTIDQYAQAGLEEMMIPFVPRAIMVIILNHLLLTYQNIFSPRTRAFIKDVCTLAPEAGTGGQSLEMFYFDSADKTCKTFTYSGSGGNENKFKKATNCYIKCDPMGSQGNAVLSERRNKDHVFTAIEFLQQRGGISEPLRVITQLKLLQTLD